MIIIGDPTDPHVAAVARLVEGVAIFDASSLTSRPYRLRPESFSVGDLTVDADRPTRGWIRRLAPAEWSHAVVTGSQQGAARAASVSLLAGVARCPGLDWLTPLDPQLIAESKLVQLRAAAIVGVRAPRTVVTGAAAPARESVGRDAVIKPLGPGNYTRADGSEAVVFATATDLDDPSFADLGPTPFLVQERIDARTHYRVVTVVDRCWVASLPAGEYPMDWRSDARAHHSFIYEAAPDGRLVEGALAMARQLHLGYSSQDWVEDSDGDVVVLDVNPGGQWAFLPDPVPGDVARALATWLEGIPS